MFNAAHIFKEKADVVGNSLHIKRWSTKNFSLSERIEKEQTNEEWIRKRIASVVSDPKALALAEFSWKVYEKEGSCYLETSGVLVCIISGF